MSCGSKDILKNVPSSVLILIMTSQIAGPILENRGMRAIFQKKGKKGQNI